MQGEAELVHTAVHHNSAPVPRQISLCKEVRISENAVSLSCSFLISIQISMSAM